MLISAALLAACGEPSIGKAGPRGSGDSLFATTPSERWRLPDQLREVSGLAASPDGRLFTHDDERAVIYEIDAVRGAIVKSFALGDPIETGDFEGLTIAPDGAFWMTTSEGRLYRFREGANGAHVAFETFDSGLRDVCEIEGLATLPSGESLILACKQNHARDMRNAVSLYRWPFSGEAELWRELSNADVASAAGVAHFRPSSVDIDAASGRILLLSASDSAFAEFDAGGALLTARALGREHVKPEGASVLSDGTLVIADEGSDGRALLTRYARAP